MAGITKFLDSTPIRDLPHVADLGRLFPGENAALHLSRRLDPVAALRGVCVDMHLLLDVMLLTDTLAMGHNVEAVFSPRIRADLPEGESLQQRLVCCGNKAQHKIMLELLHRGRDSTQTHATRSGAGTIRIVAGSGDLVAVTLLHFPSVSLMRAVHELTKETASCAVTGSCMFELNSPVGEVVERHGFVSWNRCSRPVSSAFKPAYKVSRNTQTAYVARCIGDADSKLVSFKGTVVGMPELDSHRLKKEDQLKADAWIMSCVGDSNRAWHPAWSVRRLAGVDPEAFGGLTALLKHLGIGMTREEECVCFQTYTDSESSECSRVHRSLRVSADETKGRWLLYTCGELRSRPQAVLS